MRHPHVALRGSLAGQRHETGTHGWWNPVTLTVSVGSIESGTLTDVYKEHDDTNLVLVETTGTPATVVQFDYASVPGSDRNLVVQGYYDGNPAHTVKWQQWDYTAEEWDDITGATMPNAASEQSYDWELIDDADHISGGAMQIRVNHTSAGNINHRMYLNKVYLKATPAAEMLYVEPVAEEAIAIPEYSVFGRRVPLCSQWTWDHVGLIRKLARCKKNP